MSKPDRLEVWIGDGIMLGVDSSHAPLVGDLLSIRKVTYRVVARSFAIDFADQPLEEQVRCAITVEAEP